MNDKPDTKDPSEDDQGELIDGAFEQVDELREGGTETLSASGSPAAGRADSRSVDPPSDSFTGYTIIGEIHRGGQGVVYKAFQKSTKRKVAIKVMKEGPFASSADKARFDREVQILGQLSHPNIVAIHDTGQAAGCHYFVMDYISGQTLSAYMAGGDHSIEDTLKLFGKICEAVNAAHLRGIIHRDLKPGNIRIDDSGEPHILDFGLAKVAAGDQQASMMTMTGQFLGSLPWASPEQAEAAPSKIDTRTDVYSLGVIFYQMLTGKFPYEVIGNMRDVLDRIMKTEPARPSTIRKQINNEVETIVLKALSKERDRRYQTAGELGRDVQHYLVGEPIEAKRDSVGYVLRKQLKRFKVAVGIATAFVLVVTVGFVTSFNEAHKARRQAAIAQAINGFLNNDLLAAVAPSAEAGRGREVSMRQVLDAAAEKIEGKFENEPLVHASIRTTLGETYRRLGEYDLAEPHLQRALELRLAERGEEHVETLISMNNLATLYEDQGQLQQAEILYLQTLDTRRRVLAKEHADTLASMENLAGLYVRQGRYAQAEPLLVGALETSRRVLGEEHRGTLTALCNLGALYHNTNRYDEAEPLYVKALEVRSRVLGKEDPDTLISMNNLAEFYRTLGRLGEAEAMHRQSLQAHRRVLGDEHPYVATSLNNLGLVLADAGDYEHAESYHREAVTIGRKVLADNHADLAVWVMNLARDLQHMGDYAGAEPLYEEALGKFRAQLGDEHQNTLVTLYNFADLLRDEGKYDRAEPLYRKAVETAELALSAGHWNTAAFRCGWGRCLADLERYDEAERQLLACREGLKTALGEDHQRVPRATELLVGLYEAWSKPEQAAAWRAKLPARQEPPADSQPIEPSGESAASVGSKASPHADEDTPP